MGRKTSSTKTVLILAVIIVAGVVAYGVLTMPDQRSATQKIGDAFHELPNDPTAASRELEDRTPGQKLGDAIKDHTSSQ